MTFDELLPEMRAAAHTDPKLAAMLEEIDTLQRLTDEQPKGLKSNNDYS